MKHRMAQLRFKSEDSYRRIRQRLKKDHKKLKRKLKNIIYTPILEEKYDVLSAVNGGVEIEK